MNEPALRQILESLPDAVLVVARDGSLAYANAAAARLFGYPHDGLAGASIESLIPENLRDSHPAFGSGAGGDDDGRVGGPIEVTGVKAGGEAFPADVALSSIRAGGEDLVAAVVREVPGRLEAQREVEELQEQLLRAQRLESIGQLAGGIAHDFNNLLSVIMNYASFAARALPEGDPVRSDIEHIQAAGERAAALTHQLLLFSRRETAQPEVIDLNVIVSDMERLLRRSIGEQIRLVVSLAGNLHPVFADPRKLEQVLLNLAVNARDALPEGGTLEIETANVDVDEPFARVHPGVKPGPHVTVTVTDDGIGMDAETRSRALEPFFTTKERGPGSGLGLSASYGIVSQAAGALIIASEPGKGTTVRILLPASRESVGAQAAAPAVVAAPAARGTVLIVEDEVSVLELTRRILDHAGYTVMVAEGPDEAIAMCEQNGPVDLLLTDMVMPEISGLDLARRLREVNPQMRVALMTGYTRDYLERYKKIGDRMTLVQKPFTSERLLQGVRSALDARPVALPPPD